MTSPLAPPLLSLSLCRRQAGQLPAFSPLMFLPLMALPYAVIWLKLSAWWLLPASFLYLSYLHNIKTRRETRR